MENDARLLWQPSEATQKNSNLRHYMDWLAKNGLQFFSYRDLQTWSAEQPALFWESIWHYFKVIHGSPYQSVLSGTQMPDIQWFSGATLNYAAHIFRQKTDERPAIISQKEGGELVETSWASLESQTAAVADFLRKKGVKKGDRVVGFLPNAPEAMVACLAAMSIGAVWSCCSPDFGAASVADRFQQIEPKVLFAVDGFKAYVSTILKVFRDPLRTGRRGHPRLVGWDDLHIVQVVKQRAGKRLTAITRRLAYGSLTRAEAIVQATQVELGRINTSVGGTGLGGSPKPATSVCPVTLAGNSTKDT